MVPPERRDLAKQLFHDAISGQVRALGDAPVWMNGGVMVIDVETGLTSRAIDRLQRTVDYLQETNPTSGDVTISVLRDLGQEGAYGGARMRYAEDEPSMIYLRLNEQNDDLVMQPYHSMQWHQNSTPLTKGEWGIMHEWGHTHDRSLMDPVAEEARDSLFESVMNSPVLRGTSSRYAQASAAEMYAESFADWSATQGSTDNPVTELFAITFGWSM
jgi:hypothetical protein